MTCLDNKINFLPAHTYAQIHIHTQRYRLTHTGTGDHFVWQVAGEFSLVNRHYCEMAVYWIIITLSAINLVSVLSVCAGVCVCAGMYACACLCLTVCGCCWQVRDRRGLARLNYVYDYILLQKHTHAYTHTYTQCRTMRSHTNTRTHTGTINKRSNTHRHLHTQMNLFSGCQPQCIEL